LSGVDAVSSPACPGGRAGYLSLSDQCRLMRTVPGLAPGGAGPPIRRAGARWLGSIMMALAGWPSSPSQSRAVRLNRLRFRRTMPGPEGSDDSLAEASDSLLVGRVGPSAAPECAEPARGGFQGNQAHLGRSSARPRGPKACSQGASVLGDEQQAAHLWRETAQARQDGVVVRPHR
jgi:hypothetical protein